MTCMSYVFLELQAEAGGRGPPARHPRGRRTRRRLGWGDEVGARVEYAWAVEKEEFLVTHLFPVGYPIR